jgi:hypothetical protein
VCLEVGLRFGVDVGYSSRGGFEFPMGRRTPQSNTGSGTPGAPADSESHRPWRWLGLFGRFLLLWPALALFGAVEDFDGETELEDFLVVAFVPALVGIVFVALDWLLTKTLSGAVEKRGHPVPSVFRDVSNVCLTLFVLVLVGLILAGFVFFLTDEVEPSVGAGVDPLVGAGVDPLVGVGLATVLALTLAGALCFRLLSRLLHGPNRQQGLGGWNDAPMLLRWMGYGTLIPLFLLNSVMLVDDSFTLGESLLLLLFFWISLRSAMARAPGVWATQPWEVTIRSFSLWFPWIAVVGLLGLGFGALLVAFPFLEDWDTGAAVVVWVLLFPLGIFSLAFTSVLLWRLGRSQLPKLSVSQALNRRPGDLKTWSLESDGTLVLNLASRAVTTRWERPSPELVAYLEAYRLELMGTDG